MSAPSPPTTRWGLERDERGDVHVFPIDDLLDHDDSDDCVCLPFIEIQSNFKYLIVHNAWDGRP
jgi:hypothetical protein